MRPAKHVVTFTQEELAFDPQSHRPATGEAESSIGLAGSWVSSTFDDKDAAVAVAVGISISAGNTAANARNHGRSSIVEQRGSGSPTPHTPSVA